MLQELIEAATREDWELVDGYIPEVCEDDNCLNWALGTGINHQNEHIRDLAVSILEKTKKLPSFSKPRLYLAMRKDSNPYVQYHAAFALAAHYPLDKLDEDVRRTLKEAVKDPDVSEIAKGYLTAVQKT